MKLILDLACFTYEALKQRKCCSQYDDANNNTNQQLFIVIATELESLFRLI